MQPYKIDFYIYADSPTEAEDCKNAIRDFVSAQRDRGVAVTADKITKAVRQWGGNPLITNFFKS